MQEDKKPFGKLENLKLPEVGKMTRTAPKTTQKVGKFDNSSKLGDEAKTVNQFDNVNKLEKEGKSVGDIPQTPMKIGKDYIPYDASNVINILEGGAKSVLPLSITPNKTTQEVNQLDNSSKLESEAKNVDKLTDTPTKNTPNIPNLSETPTKNTPNISDLSTSTVKESVTINNIIATPEKTTIEISPFNSLGNLERLQSFSSNNTDKISETNFLKDTHAKGFNKNFDEGSTTKYTKDPSNLTLGSDLDNHTFNQDNKYLDDLSTKQNGNFPSNQLELSKNSTNPLLTTHWEDIGLPTPGHNNVTQAVDFMGASNSYFEAISPEIPGFTQSPVLKYTLFGEENFGNGVSLSNMGKIFPSLITSGITPAILDGESAGSNFDDGSGNITTTKI